MGRTLLLTGRPGVGKTTILKKACKAFGDRAVGFYTEEIRTSDGRRAGFRLVTTTGEETVMAHTDLCCEGRPRVSRYGVDIRAIEEVGVVALRRTVASNGVVIVDEIGKMELFSQAFRDAVLDAVEGELPVLGTVMSGHHPWVDKVKGKEQVEVWEVTMSNRADLLDRIQQWMMR